MRLILFKPRSLPWWTTLELKSWIGAHLTSASGSRHHLVTWSSQVCKIHTLNTRTAAFPMKNEWLKHTALLFPGLPIIHNVCLFVWSMVLALWMGCHLSSLWKSLILYLERCALSVCGFCTHDWTAWLSNGNFYHTLVRWKPIKLFSSEIVPWGKLHDLNKNDFFQKIVFE